MKHREVSQGMFPNFPVDAITNGVHAMTWTAPAFQELFDRRIPEWRTDNLYLRYAVGIPLPEIRAAHVAAKQDFLAEVARRTKVELDANVFTIGFARRATPYKRADLMFSEPDRLARIAEKVGGIQIVFGGKAHPHDEGGKELIRRIHEAAAQLKGRITVVYLENYEIAIAAKMVAGVDLWVNNPMKPLEASGTSGMKAALNGGLNLSVLDGWWEEGYDGTNGWAIRSDPNADPAAQDAQDAAALVDLLKNEVLPEFYERDGNGVPRRWVQRVKGSLRTIGPRFCATRMLHDYVRFVYRLG